MRPVRLSAASAAVFFVFLAGGAAAQGETSTSTLYGDLQYVTQDMLDRAAGDGQSPAWGDPQRCQHCQQ